MENKTQQKPIPRNTEPTQKQKQAFDKLVVNGGNKADALRKVGYSPAVVKTPQKVTESKGWKQLEAKYLAEDKLLKVHEEGLDATKTKYRFEEVETTDKDGNIVMKMQKVPYEVPDPVVRHKYLDTAYKVLGKYPKEGDNTLNVNVFSLADLAEKHTKRKQLGFVEISENEENVVVEPENDTQN